MAKQAPNFERSGRTSLSNELLSNPEMLYDVLVAASYTALELAWHYNDRLVSAVAPVLDDGSNSKRGQPLMKLLSAGNYKPAKEKHPDDKYTRVCAEQNLFDNPLEEGDTWLGPLFVRASEGLDDIEGTGLMGDAIKMCRPCRRRSLQIIGSELLVISLRGDSLEPIEASTLGQQITAEDMGGEKIVIARGPEDVRDYVVEALASGLHSKKIERLPIVPSRIYSREQQN